MVDVTIPIFDINNSKPKTGCVTKSVPCYVCCGRALHLDVRHLHLSTQYYNKQCALEGQDRPMCYNCLLHHPIDMMSRTRVILSSSTLFGVPFMPKWNGTPMHVDWECVAGAVWETLRKCWERSYGQHPLPVDTIAVGGMNDIHPIVASFVDPRVSPINEQLEKEEVISKIKAEFMVRVDKLKTTVDAHKNHKKTDDTLAISRLFRVPAFYWGTDDGEYPSNNYTNYRPVIDAINLAIEDWNAMNGSSKVPNLQNTGRRTVGKGARTLFIFNRFIEAENDKKLHFKDEFRVDITNRFIKYFEHRTPRVVNYME